MVLNVEAKQHVFMYIEEGHYFGEIDLLSQSVLTGGTSKKSKFDNKRKFTTVASENVELLLWSKKNIYLADSEFDDVIKSILQTAKSRYQKAINAKKQAAEYYNSLQEKANKSNFAPIVTRAHTTGDDNIFQNRKLNYNEDGGNGTIHEESEDNNHDQTFEQLQNNKNGIMTPINRRKQRDRMHTDDKNKLDQDSIGSADTPKVNNLLSSSLKKASARFNKSMTNKQFK